MQLLSNQYVDFNSTSQDHGPRLLRRSWLCDHSCVKLVTLSISWLYEQLEGQILNWYEEELNTTGRVEDHEERLALIAGKTANMRITKSGLLETALEVVKIASETVRLRTEREHLRKRLSVLEEEAEKVELKKLRWGRESLQCSNLVKIWIG